MHAKKVKNNFLIKKNNKFLSINIFDVTHGMINASGFMFEKVAYISDCNRIPIKSLQYLYNLEYLVIDCLREKKHPSHLNLNDALKLIKILKPKKTILTNLHIDLDYDYLRKKLPPNIVPAFDGYNFTF